MEFLRIPSPLFLFSFTASPPNILHILFIYCCSEIYLLCKAGCLPLIRSFLWKLLADFFNALDVWAYISHAQALEPSLTTPCPWKPHESSIPPCTPVTGQPSAEMWIWKSHGPHTDRRAWRAMSRWHRFVTTARTAAAPPTEAHSCPLGAASKVDEWILSLYTMNVNRHNIETTFLGGVKLFLVIVVLWRISSFAVKCKCDFSQPVNGKLNHVCLFLKIWVLYFYFSYPRVSLSVRTHRCGQDQSGLAHPSLG